MCVVASAVWTLAVKDVTRPVGGSGGGHVGGWEWRRAESKMGPKGGIVYRREEGD